MMSVLFTVTALIVGEIFNGLIKCAVKRQVWKGIKIGIKDRWLSHLQFADDSILFSEKDKDVMEHIKAVICWF